MKENLNNVLYAIGYTSSSVGVAISVVDLQNVLAIISTIISIISIIVLTIFKVVDAYKKAKSDGKITDEDKQEIKDTIKDGINNIDSIINDSKKK
jgi:hypothetical protein